MKTNANQENQTRLEQKTMRFYDLRKIKALLEALEEGNQPTEKQITDAREAVNRETQILQERKERYQEIFSRRFMA